MTLKGYFAWFKDNWEKTGLVVGFFLTIYAVVIVLPRSTLLFALMLSFPLYVLHEADEYIFPGGFAQFLNKNIYKTDPEHGMLDTNAEFLINMVVWFFVPLSSLQAFSDLTQAAWMPYFYILQAVIHLILGIAGKRFFNPGMLTAWLLHVPWGIWTIWLLVRAGVISNPYWNGYLVSSLLIVLGMGIAGGLLFVRYKWQMRKIKHA